MSLIATAPASSAARATSGWNVSAMTGTPERSASPAIAGASFSISAVGLDRRARARRDGAHVEEVEALLDEAEPVLDRLLGRDAPRARRRTSRR